MVKKATKLPVATSNSIGPSSYRPSPEDKARERRYRAEDALRDIERAEGYKKDSGLMKDVRSLAKEKVASLKKIC